MSVDVYSYFNSVQLATLFDAVAAITASHDYLDIFKIIAMLGFLVFIAGMAVGKAQEPLEFFRWLIIVMLVHSVLLIPKTDVVILDRTGTQAPIVKANVPIGLAFFASVTSHIGDAITRAFETVFAQPTDLQFQKNGLMFGSTVLTNTLQAVPVSPVFRDDLTKFINNCTYFDLLANRIDPSLFAKSDDVWSMMAATSVALLTPISTTPDGVMLCSDAYANLNNRFPAEVLNTLQSTGRKLNPAAANNVIAGTMLDTQIATSYSNLTNISKTATDSLRQNMAVNTVRDSQMISAQQLDAPSSAIIGAAQAQTELTTNINYITMARVAERAAPAIRNVIEIICYAVFPIIILLMVIAGEHAGQMLKGYIMTLVWIQLIPPLYAILNFVMNSVTKISLVGIASSTNPLESVNLVNIGALSQGGLSDMAIAGYLTLSLPIIAWALVKGGEISGSALFGAAFSPAQGTSGHSAGNLATGNISQGNVSLDLTSSNNVTQDQYNAAPSMNSGSVSSSNAMGRATMGSDGTFRYQSNQSALGFSANFGQKIGNALSQEASARQEIAIRETEASNTSKTAALVERMGISKAYADSHGNNNSQDTSSGSRSGQTISKLNQIAENVNKRLGLNSNSNVGHQIVGEMSLGGNLSAGVKKALGVSIGLNDKDIRSAGASKNLDATIGFARDELKSQNISSDQALSSDFRSSNAYQWAKQNRSESVKGEDASLSRATQHSRNADVAASEAFSLSSQARKVEESWSTNSMDYTGYVANRLHQEGKLDAFNMLYQNNPDAAAKLAGKYLIETNSDLKPTMSPLSNNLSDIQKASPELSGKTIRSETLRFGTPGDTTTRSHSQNMSQIYRHGFSQPTIRNDVGPTVLAANEKTGKEITDQGGATSTQVSTSRSEAEHTLPRVNQIGGVSGPKTDAPKQGSAADQQDIVYKDLFKNELPPPNK